MEHRHARRPPRSPHRSPLRNARRVLAGLCLVLPLTGLAACGGDDSSKASSTAPAASYEIVPDAAVTAGLAKLDPLVSQLASATKANVEERHDAVEEVWESVEGTIKKNEPDIYLQFEEAIEGLERAGKAGDAPAAAKALGDYQAAAAAYRAKHP